jgi:hypothetical protein
MDLDKDDLMLIAFLIERAHKDHLFTKVGTRLDSLRGRIHNELGVRFEILDVHGSLVDWAGDHLFDWEE